MGQGPSFAEIRYAQVWEDPRVLRRGLRIAPGDTVLSIGAAGDNAFALLLDDPGLVHVVDFSPAQLALVDLKRTALATLEADDLHVFFAVRSSSVRSTQRSSSAARLALWQRALRPRVAEATRAYVDARLELIERGLLGAGRFERYLATFRLLILPLVEARDDVEALLACTSLEAQRALFERRWNNRRWRALFRVFFGRTLLGRLGRDPAFFAFVDEGDVGSAFLRRAERGICALPVADNHVIEWILTGQYSGRHGLPPWLEPSNLPVLRARLERLVLVQDSLDGALRACGAQRFAAFNLSDIFEWMSPAQSLETLRLVVDHAQEGARLLYWNLLVPRRRPEVLAHVLQTDDTSALHAIDRCFFYRDVVVERVIAGATVG